MIKDLLLDLIKYIPIESQFCSRCKAVQRAAVLKQEDVIFKKNKVKTIWHYSCINCGKRFNQEIKYELLDL